MAIATKGGAPGRLQLVQDRIDLARKRILDLNADIDAHLVDDNGDIDEVITKQGQLKRLEDEIAALKDQEAFLSKAAEAQAAEAKADRDKIAWKKTSASLAEYQRIAKDIDATVRVLADRVQEADALAVDIWKNVPAKLSPHLRDGPLDRSRYEGAVRRTLYVAGLKWASPESRLDDGWPTVTEIAERTKRAVMMPQSEPVGFSNAE